MQRYFFIEVSSTAYRLMRTKGGLDQYILTTKPKDMRSKFGELLRSHMLKKKEDPAYVPPYIPQTKKIYPVTARKKNMKQQSPIWLPLELRNKDLTEFELDINKLMAMCDEQQGEGLAKAIPDSEPTEAEISAEDARVSLKVIKKIDKQPGKTDKVKKKRGADAGGAGEQPKA